jgi:hypothetical protein
MSNQQGSHETPKQAPKTPAPGEAKPAPQQNQGDGQSGNEKPAQQK